MPKRQLSVYILPINDKKPGKAVARFIYDCPMDVCQQTYSSTMFSSNSNDVSNSFWYSSSEMPSL